MADKINPRERKVELNYVPRSFDLVFEHCFGNFLNGVQRLYGYRDKLDKEREGYFENLTLDSQAKFVQYIERALSDPRCSEDTFRGVTRDELVQLVAMAEQIDWRDHEKMVEFEDYCRKRQMAIPLTDEQRAALEKLECKR